MNTVTVFSAVRSSFGKLHHGLRRVTLDADAALYRRRSRARVLGRACALFVFACGGLLAPRALATTGGIANVMFAGGDILHVTCVFENSNLNPTIELKQGGATLASGTNTLIKDLRLDMAAGEVTVVYQWDAKVDDPGGGSHFERRTNGPNPVRSSGSGAIFGEPLWPEDIHLASPLPIQAPLKVSKSLTIRGATLGFGNLPISVTSALVLDDCTATGATGLEFSGTGTVEISNSKWNSSALVAAGLARFGMENCVLNQTFLQVQDVTDLTIQRCRLNVTPQRSTTSGTEYAALGTEAAPVGSLTLEDCVFDSHLLFDPMPPFRVNASGTALFRAVEILDGAPWHASAANLQLRDCVILPTFSADGSFSAYGCTILGWLNLSSPGSASLTGNHWGRSVGPLSPKIIIKDLWPHARVGTCVSFDPEQHVALANPRWKTAQLPDGAERPKPTLVGIRGPMIGHTVLKDKSSVHMADPSLRAGFPILVSYVPMASHETMTDLSGADFFLKANGVEITPENACEIRASSPAPKQATDSLNFVIPNPVAGALKVELFQRDRNGGEPVLKSTANVTVQGSFLRPLRIGVVRVKVDMPGEVLSTPARDAANKVAERLRQDLTALWALKDSKQPFPEVDVVELGDYHFDGGALGGKWKSLTDLMDSYWVTGLPSFWLRDSNILLINSLSLSLRSYYGSLIEETGKDMDYLVGVVPTNLLRGGAEGATVNPFNLLGEVALVDQEDPEAAIHELGHCLGLDDQYGGGGWVSGLLIDAWVTPVEATSLFDPFGVKPEEIPGRIRGVPARIPAKPDVYDFMGNATNPFVTWITAEQFASVQTILGGILGRAPTPSPAPAPAVTKTTRRVAPRTMTNAPAAGQKRLRLHNLFSSDRRFRAGRAVDPLNPVRVYDPLGSYIVNDDGAPANLGATGRVSGTILEALDAAGTVLAQANLRDSPTPLTGPQPDTTEWEHTVDVPAATASVRIVHPFYRIRQWLRTQVPAVPATALTTGPADTPWILQWPEDPSAGVRFRVWMDAGDGWQAIGNWQRSNRAEVHAEQVPVGQAPVFRVVAAGLMQQVVSAEVTGSARTAPAAELTVLEPFDGALAPLDHQWRLQAQLSGTAGVARWSSDVDGLLGTGLSLTGVKLSAGAHVLSCACDGGGPVAAVHVQVTTAEVAPGFVVGESSLVMRRAGFDPQVPDLPSGVAFNGEDTVVGFATRITGGGLGEARLTVDLTRPGGTVVRLADERVSGVPLERFAGRWSFRAESRGQHRISLRLAGLPDGNNEDPVAAPPQLLEWEVGNVAPIGVTSFTGVTPGLDEPIPWQGLDPNGDDLVVRWVTPPAHGRLEKVGSVWIYRSAPGYSGKDEAWFEVEDPDGARSAATRMVFDVVAALEAPPALFGNRPVLRLANPVVRRPSLHDLGDFTRTAAEFLDPLPPGVTFDPYDFTFNGTLPAGWHSFRARLQGPLGEITSRFYLTDGTAPPMDYSRVTAPADGIIRVQAGQAFEYFLQANPPPYWWEATEWSFPAGMHLDGATGRVWGTVSSPGDYRFTVYPQNASIAGGDDLVLRVVDSASMDDDGDGIPNGRDLFSAVPAHERIAGPVALRPSWPSGTTQFAATGLPSGIVLNPNTGQLSGIPVKTGVYTVRMRAFVGGVWDDWQTVVLTVDPLPTSAVGTFVAWSEAVEDPDLGGGFGARLDLTTSGKDGSCSGKISFRGASYSFRGKLDASPGADPALRIDVPAGGGRPVHLDVSFGSGHLVAGTLDDKSGHSAAVSGWRNVWNTKGNPAWGGRDLNLNVALGNASGEGPGGSGLAVVSLQRAGTASWAGTLSDGRTFTASLPASPNAEVPLLAWLDYPNGGFVRALLETGTAGGLWRVAAPAAPNGWWFKQGSTATADRSYRDGFDVALSIRGAEFRTTKGQLLFGAGTLANAPVALDWRMTGAAVETASGFAGHLAGNDVSLPVNLSNKNTMAFAVTGLPVSLKPGFSASKATLGATANLSDTGGGGIVARTMSIKGLYIPDPVTPNASRVEGFFQLPALPAGGASSSTTPILSGSITVGRKL